MRLSGPTGSRGAERRSGKRGGRQAAQARRSPGHQETAGVAPIRVALSISGCGRNVLDVLTILANGGKTKIAGNDPGNQHIGPSIIQAYKEEFLRSRIWAGEKGRRFEPKDPAQP